MRLGRPKVALILTEDERVRLDLLAHRSRTAHHLARRARINPGVCASVSYRPIVGQLQKPAHGAGGFEPDHDRCWQTRVDARPTSL
jgi:hypothetical protein